MSADQHQLKQAFRARWLTELNGGNLDPLTHVQPSFEDDDFLPIVTNFIAAHPTFARELFNISGAVPGLGTGIGKGEAIIYFIYDNVTLGGLSSSIDVHVSGIPYVEVKAARNLGNGIWADFRLGTDEFTASHRLLYHVVELMLQLEAKGKLVVPEHYGNIPKTMFDTLCSLAPRQTKRLFDDYFAKLFSGRIGSKRYLFFDIDSVLPVYYGRLERSQLRFERFSAGQAKLLFNPTSEW